MLAGSSSLRRNGKRGVHNSRTSLSTKRIAEQFRDTGNEQVISYKSKKSVDRVQRALNDGDRASNNAWANAMLSALGINKDLTEAPSKRRRTEHASVARRLRVALKRAGMFKSSIHPDNIGIAHLDDSDTEFVFDISHVPDPPAINFSNDIDRLFHEWESSMLLIVNGRGIPVKHWGQFYKKVVGAKEAAWDALKSKWGKWKFIVSERENAYVINKFSTEYTIGRITSTAEDAANARTLLRRQPRSSFCAWRIPIPQNWQVLFANEGCRSLKGMAQAPGYAA
ncbi:hypothetical protein BU15DRAFT_73548 [Melanogaster broomeanus]|nr:hypothetical protein BU15DRAFT_73548 [Melanogaster broomeanus]